MPDDSDPPPFDLEALQAQIDLSISITHNLVASWLPDPSSSSSRSGSGSIYDAAAQKEIDDYQAELQRNLHRPPTLGLGAAIPATSNHATARDVARLKGNLTKGSKKRSRDEYQADGTSPAPTINGNGDEDDEDSRSGAIKSSSKGASTSKTNGIVNGVGKGSSRLSVFEGNGKKKKKKANDAIHPAVAAALLAANGNGNDGFVEPAPPSLPLPLSNGDTISTSVAESESTPVSSQVDTQTESQSTLQSVLSQPSSSQIPPSLAPTPTSPIPASRPPSPSSSRRSKSPSKSKFSSLPPAPPSPSINRVFPNAFDPPAPPSSISASIDETPTATEADTGSDDEDDGVPSSAQGEPNGMASPQVGGKKKRKRRKRKKKGALAANGTAGVEGGAANGVVIGA